MEFEKAKELFKKNTETMAAYSHAMGVLSYDSETAAPKNSAEGLGRTYGVLSEIIYKLTVNEEQFEVIDTMMSNLDKLDFITRREVEEKARELNQMRKIPMDEYTAFQVLLTEAHNAWVEAKNTDNYSVFEPYLAQIVEYNRKIAAYVSPETDAYDYWLNEFERGASKKMLDVYFEKLRSALVPLIHAICEKGDVINTSFLEKSCPIETQRKLSDYIMDVMKINRDDCSIGETEHPFTTEFNKHDVRITTHYYENMVASSMYSVIHEGGHAIYELNTGDDLIGTTMAGGASMGIHESQSRFYENILGRRPAFWIPIYGKLGGLLPQFKEVPFDTFCRAINDVHPSYIRTEADEVTYCLHIILRYEMEKAIFRDQDPTDQLPALWNDKMEALLGIRPGNDAEGILQDMHWSDGSFGYFPSYLLGSVYDGMFLNQLEKELGNTDTILEEGRILEITAWLEEKIHRYGSMYNSREVIQRVCGCEISARPLLDYFQKKYSRIYGF